MYIYMYMLIYMGRDARERREVAEELAVLGEEEHWQSPVQPHPDPAVVQSYSKVQ